MLFRALLLFSVALLQYEVHSYRTSSFSTTTDRDELSTAGDLSGVERMKQLVDAFKSQDSDESSSSSEEDRSRRGRQRNGSRRGNFDRRRVGENQIDEEDQSSERRRNYESNSRGGFGGWNDGSDSSDFSSRPYSMSEGGQSYLYPYSTDSFSGRRVPFPQTGRYIYGQNYGNPEGLNYIRGRRFMPAMVYETDDVNQGEGIRGRQGGRFGGRFGESIYGNQGENQNVPYGSRYGDQSGVSGSQGFPYGSRYGDQTGRQDVPFGSRYGSQSDSTIRQGSEYGSTYGGSDVGYKSGQSSQSSGTLDFLVGSRPSGNSAGDSVSQDSDSIRDRRYLPQGIQDEERFSGRVSGSTEIPSNANGGGYSSEDRSGENSDSYLGGRRGDQSINQDRQFGVNSDKYGRRPVGQNGQSNINSGIRQRRCLPLYGQDYGVQYGKGVSGGRMFPIGMSENCQGSRPYGGIDYLYGGMQPGLNYGDIDSSFDQDSYNVDEADEAGLLNENYRGRRYIPLREGVSDYVYQGLGPIGGRLLPSGVRILTSLNRLPVGERGMGYINQRVVPLDTERNILEGNILDIGQVGRNPLIGYQSNIDSSLRPLYIPLRDRSFLPSNIIDYIRQSQVLGRPLPLVLNSYNTPGSVGVSLERPVLPYLRNIYGIQDRILNSDDLGLALRSLSPVQIQEGLYVNPVSASGIQGVPRLSEEQLAYLPRVAPIGVSGVRGIGENDERLGLGLPIWNSLGGKYGYALRKEGIFKDDEGIVQGPRRGGKLQKSKTWSVKYRGSRRN